jgi:hypothetical protein
VDDLWQVPLLGAHDDYAFIELFAVSGRGPGAVEASLDGEHAGLLLVPRCHYRLSQLANASAKGDEVTYGTEAPCTLVKPRRC